MGGRVVYRARSPLSGLVTVVETRADRRLVVDGAVLSTYARDGDWTRARREYWGEALDMVALPPRPRVLLVGLGGGTQVHLLHERLRPRHITVVERDPLIVRIAHRWFGLAEVPGLECLCAEAEVAARTLARARRRFDFVMEDCTYDETSARSIPLALALARLVSRRGVLIVNRHRRPHARETARALAPLFASVWTRRIRREADNILVSASGRPRPPAPRAQAGWKPGGGPASRRQTPPS